MNFWDQQFASDEFKYGKQPNAFLVEQAGLIAPGADILIPGDGEGRNSVWLARQGHRVLAVDASEVGLAKTSGGPKNPELLYSLDLIRDDFSGILQETYGVECEVNLDEGLGHQGPACVTRYIGQRA